LVVGEEVPGVATGLDDVVVGFEDAVGELVLAQVLPDVFGRVEFGRIGRQADQGEVFGKLEPSRAMVAGTVEDNDGVSTLGDGFADFGEVEVEGVGIGARQD